MSPDDMMGRTRDNTTCVFKGQENLMGKTVKLEVKGASPNTLKCEMLATEVE